MPLTSAQTKLYWREWASARGYCQGRGLPEPDRHALHERALGGPKSSKAFTNEDFDKVLAEFRAIYRPDSVNAQLRQLRQPRRRREFTIEELLRCLALYVSDAEAYAAGICVDRFHTPFWRELSEVKVPHKSDPRESSSPMDQFRWTLAGRLNGAEGLRNQAGDSLHDMYTRAGIECGCASLCAKRGFVVGRVAPRAPQPVPIPAGHDHDDNNEPF